MEKTRWYQKVRLVWMPIPRHDLPFISPIAAKIPGP